MSELALPGLWLPPRRQVLRKPWWLPGRPLARRERDAADVLAPAIGFDAELGTNTGAGVSSLGVSVGTDKTSILTDAFLYIARCNHGVTLNSVSDSEGNGWTVLGNKDDGASHNIAVALMTTNSFGLSLGDNVSGVFSTTATILAEVCCFSGFTHNGQALDQASPAASGTSTAPASANVTTLHANEVALGIIPYAGSATTFAAGTGFTKMPASSFGSGTVQQMGIEWQILSGTQTLNAAATLGGPRTWAAAIFTIYDSGATGGSTEHELSACGAGH